MAVHGGVDFVAYCFGAERAVANSSSGCFSELSSRFRAGSRERNSGRSGSEQEEGAERKSGPASCGDDEARGYVRADPGAELGIDVDYRSLYAEGSAPDNLDDPAAGNDLLAADADDPGRISEAGVRRGD